MEKEQSKNCNPKYVWKDMMSQIECAKASVPSNASFFCPMMSAYSSKRKVSQPLKQPSA
jgi:hypothetical protein